MNITYPSPPPGTIAVLSGELARYSEFPEQLIRIQRPEGTRLEWAVGVDIAKARNQLVRNFLTTNGQWLWFVDDDMIPQPDTLMRLLGTPTEIVQPLVLMRKPPFLPTFYSGPNQVTNLYDWRVLEPHMTLVPVDACGTGGMLIRRHVFEQLADPWFEIGKIRPDQMGEDLFFCQKARAAGIGIHVDTTIPMEHLTTCAIRATKTSGEWLTEVRIGNTILAVPAASAAPSPSDPSS